MTSLRVTAPARLHLGFLDPGATLGRCFGSLGLSINGIATVVRADAQTNLPVEDAADERVAELVARVVSHYALPAGVRVVIEERIPEHVGLGSGTQLAVAVGTAVTGLFGRPAPAAEIAYLLARGKRSGIGLGLFERGGLLLDAGHGRDTRTPPPISHLLMPENWRVILISDAARDGLNGPDETSAFKALAPLEQDRAAHLCHLTLMRLLPAVHEQDFETFSASLGEIQALIGDHFASVQAGRFSSHSVREAVDFCVQRCALKGVGQSSWGPTAFAFVADEGAAIKTVAALGEEFDTRHELTFRICTLRNRGADIEQVQSLRPRCSARI